MHALMNIMFSKHTGRTSSRIRASRWLMLLVALVGGSAAAATLDCPPLETREPVVTEQPRHAHGLLWRISRADLASSYLFGTVHVSDPRVIDLPAPVTVALEGADIFIMEARLDGPGVYEFSREMFFTDGTRLSDLLPADFHERAVEILANYNISPAVADTLKPWAAFLTMSMPPDTGKPLDLVLMSLAKARGAEIHGLETPAEQAAVFDVLDEAQHVQMLKDSICYYDVLQADIEQLIQLYLDRDLAGLYAYQYKYMLHDNAVYQQFMQSILRDRNMLMVERMLPYLEQGTVFVAIGALHLPGDEGVLGLLEQAGYDIEFVY